MEAIIRYCLLIDMREQIEVKQACTLYDRILHLLGIKKIIPVYTDKYTDDDFARFYGQARYIWDEIRLVQARKAIEQS